MVALTLPQNSSVHLRSPLGPQRTRNLNRAPQFLPVNDVNLRGMQSKETRVFPRVRHAISENESSNSRGVLAKSYNPIIVIVNYDSFTYNLCQYMGELGCNFEVYRNDELTVDELKKKNPRGILISPGPGKIVRSPYGVMHGKSSLVYYNEGEFPCLFEGISNPFTVGRYHSLVIEKESFPSDALEITAWTEDGLVMAARHKVYPHLQGVQFHPESIITTEGKTIVANFIKLIQNKEAVSGN
ncbi:hypothetical protein L1987_10880 [Smallanthus sonchifolius]|uniref:Uncharacterized protein n=1 Tax=Smallanthus sonchifolius TaxID=185202 RepID=A0ACB9JAW0_9ASTR|nr:hypothetical protein L1987_10880 [Smallanthus sonchifolius]